MQAPEAYFTHPQYAATGNLFWPDAWQDQVKDSAYEMFGIDAKVAKVWCTDRMHAHACSGVWALLQPALVALAMSRFLEG
jgi:hypothetical protein